MELWKPATPELEPGSSLIALFSAGMFVPKIEYMCQSIMYEASYEMHAASRDGLSYSICVGQLHILVFHGYKQISSSNIANQSGFLAGSNVVYHYKKNIHTYTFSPAIPEHAMLNCMQYLYRSACLIFASMAVVHIAVYSPQGRGSSRQVRKA